MAINNGKISAAVLRTVISGTDRTFCFPEKTDIEAIKAYIIKAARDKKLEANENDFYYTGNITVSSTSSFDTLETVDKYLDFLIELKKKNKEQEPSESKSREWNISFTDIIERSHRKK